MATPVSNVAGLSGQAALPQIVEIVKRIQADLGNYLFFQLQIL